MTRLECVDLTRRYGGVRALDAITLTMDTGAAAGVHGIIGPNGSGKTTLFNVLSGFVRPTSGRVRFDGADVTRWPAYRRSRRGLVRTFQQAMSFPGLTVRRSLELAALAAKTGRESVERVIASAQLEPFLDDVCGSVPFGVARRLGVALALLRGPKLLLLDEPAAGLNDGESERLADLLVSLASDGTDILVVEHDLSFLARACTRLYAIDAGRLIAEGEPQDVLAAPQVVESYLGRVADATD
ncbi:MAG TPA: ATP-binding cassette domain-containing protein [Amycolatopsis sp.]|nr:ATP-binding cassette domain-containing protein [Amycolatopsis sp.]